MPRFKGWEKVRIDLVPGAEALAPVIVSASRATDIPACYPEWLIEGLKRGYVCWANPFSGREAYISFEKARAFVFWSKNPAPVIPYLPVIDRMGLQYYFQFTLNDYESEGLEPNIPPLKERISTFRKLSGLLGADRVIWRFDPLILSDSITVDDLAGRVRSIAEEIHSHTRRLVISFVDIERYKRVKRRLERCGPYREFSLEEKHDLAERLGDMNKGWSLSIQTCAEEVDLKRFGIEKGHCIDSSLLLSLFPDDHAMAAFFGVRRATDLDGNVHVEPDIMKDPGQRALCGCTVAKDIGQYCTCMHLCAYCYANASETLVRQNYMRYRSQRDCGLFSETIVPTVKERKSPPDLSDQAANLLKEQ